MDYHKILGIPSDATEQKIRDAYIKLAAPFEEMLKPDVVEKVSRFLEITAAYVALVDDDFTRPLRAFRDVRLHADVAELLLESLDRSHELMRSTFAELDTRIPIS